MSNPRFQNVGLPQPTGIRAAYRHHERSCSSYKVRKNPKLLAEHKRAMEILRNTGAIDESYCGQEDLRMFQQQYLLLSVARNDLMGLVPSSLLMADNSLDTKRAHQHDVRGLQRARTHG